MSVEYYNGNIFNAPIDILIHQANCFHVMGAGIASDIKNKYPEAYEADLETGKGEKTKLGMASFCDLGSESAIKRIYNLYAQYKYGSKEKHTNYEYYWQGLTYIKNHIITTIDTWEGIVVGVPFYMGCNRGGGSWPICEAIIKDVFDNDEEIKVLICKKD